MSQPTRPGALVAVLAGNRPALKFAADLQALHAAHPDDTLVMGTGSGGLFEVRAAGTPCGCHRCLTEDQQVRTDSGLYPWWGSLTGGMILCPDCGNKRCPRATDHDLPCGQSNDVGQPGSRYA